VKTDYNTENRTFEIQKPKPNRTTKNRNFGSVRYGSVQFSVYGKKVPTPKPKDPLQSSRTWTRPSLPDSKRDNCSHQQVHNIANQHPAGETARCQEYPPQGRGNGTRGRGRGRTQQPRRFYCLFHSEDCAHPTRDCPETKATRDRMSRAQLADNQRVVVHTYHQQHQQPYNNEQVQHPPNHAYKHSQEVQVLPPPPPHHPNPQHHNHPQAPKQEDFAKQPYHRVIHMITGGSSVDFESKRQKRDHNRSVNHVALAGLVVQTRLSLVPLTFDARDVDLRSTPHVNAMVINCNVAAGTYIKSWSTTTVKLTSSSCMPSISWHKPQLTQAFRQPPIWLWRQGHLLRAPRGG
jgi:hypothetical protein